MHKYIKYYEETCVQLCLSISNSMKKPVYNYVQVYQIVWRNLCTIMYKYIK